MSVMSSICGFSPLFLYSYSQYVFGCLSFCLRKHLPTVDLLALMVCSGTYMREL